MFRCSSEAAVFCPPRAHMPASRELMSCSTSTNGASAVQWEVAECGLPNMPTGLESSPRWRSCLSPPQSNRTAPVTSVLTLPTGYNYSAFCCSSFSLSLSHVFSVSLSARLGLDTEVQAEGRGAAALCSQHAERHSLHRRSQQVGVVEGEEGGGGAFTHWMQRPLGCREVGVVGEDLLPSNPPTYFLFALLSLNIHSPASSPSPSLIAWTAGRSSILVPPPSSPSACCRQDTGNM